jgi:hypothetical protein
MEEEAEDEPHGHITSLAGWILFILSLEAFSNLPNPQTFGTILNY